MELKPDYNTDQRSDYKCSFCSAQAQLGFYKAQQLGWYWERRVGFWYNYYCPECAKARLKKCYEEIYK